MVTEKAAAYLWKRDAKAVDESLVRLAQALEENDRLKEQLDVLQHTRSMIQEMLERPDLAAEFFADRYVKAAKRKPPK